MKKSKRVITQLIVVLLFIGGGAAALIILTLTKPPLAQKAPEVALPMVRVAKLEPRPLEIIVTGEGTVAPIRQSTVSAEVGGKVDYVSPKLISGGEFQAGEKMLGIDTSDYRLNLTLKRAQVLEAETLLTRTQQEAAAAREEWREVSGGGKEAPPLLVKKPQLAEAQAKLAAARSQLDLAELNLKRTEITAPYDCRVLEKSVDLGQYLRQGDRVASVYDTGASEIVVHLEDKELAWLAVPGLTTREELGSPALITAHFAGQAMQWQGRIVRAQGAVDERTRLVPVVVRVERPFARRPPLAPGVFVDLALSGGVRQAALVLPRIALRPDSQVWVVNDDRLEFRKVGVARIQGDQMVVESGLTGGENVVLTPLKTVAPGMRVRVADSPDQD